MLSRKTERQIGTDPAIGTMQMQRHAKLGNQLATTIRVDDLYVIPGRLVLQPPQALDMPAQIAGGRVLEVFHAASDAILRVFTSGPGAMPLTCGELNQELRAC
ncbi:hypothetical protein N5C18_13105 [Stenotrophomonas sp. GD03930]|nr:hypothetical protein [Stenotrophomonas sp. GD03930]MDH1232538.1 hypothetical protein [Stenotrophomonas sp. GD03930]